MSHTSPSKSAVLGRLPRAVTSLLVALFAVSTAAVVGPGCSSSSSVDCNTATIAPGDACEAKCLDAGGVVIDGSCVGKCEDAKCVDGNVCVDNKCALTCDTVRDCIVGQQDCVAAKHDGTGAAVQVCQDTNKAALGTPCPFGSECTDRHLSACPNGDQCDYSTCPAGSTCEKDPIACIGLANCNIGACSSGGMACKVPACAEADCKPLTCVTKGAGDADAYCSKQDCHADSDCASSFYCGVIRDPHAICAASTLLEKAGGSACGATDDQAADKSFCVDRADFQKDGATYVEGDECLLRSSCIQRKVCDPCENDAECGNLSNGVCAQIGPDPDKRCTVTCASNADCGSASDCDPRGLCVPRFGSCVGAGNFCEPCLSDLDCGSANGTNVCGANSAGERGCEKDPVYAFCDSPTDCSPTASAAHADCHVWNNGSCNADSDCADGVKCDTTARKCALKLCDECAADNDCPVLPSGAHGHCLGTDAADGVTQADFAYHRCELCKVDKDCPKSPQGFNGTCYNEAFGVTPDLYPVYHTCVQPFDEVSGKFGCWCRPASPEAACAAAGLLSSSYSQCKGTATDGCGGTVDCGTVPCPAGTGTTCRSNGLCQ